MPEEAPPKTDRPSTTTTERSTPPTPRPKPVTERVEIRYEAPLPPPSMMAHYEQILPGSAGRIVAMAEDQATHRQSLEKAKLESDIANEKRGQTYAFILSLVCILGGITIILLGQSIYGLILLILTLVTLSGVFIYGRSSQERERREQLDKLLKAMPEPHVTTSEREE